MLEEMTKSDDGRTSQGGCVRPSIGSGSRRGRDNFLWCWLCRRDLPAELEAWALTRRSLGRRMVTLTQPWIPDSTRLPLITRLATSNPSYPTSTPQPVFPHHRRQRRRVVGGTDEHFPMRSHLIRSLDASGPSPLPLYTILTIQVCCRGCCGQDIHVLGSCVRTSYPFNLASLLGAETP